MNIHRLLAIAAFFVAGSALAQNSGTVSNHAVPIGRGIGVSGFGSLGPCTNAFPMVGTGATTDPICQQLDLTLGVSGILPATNGGTNNAFVQVTGPTTSIKTFTLPNSNASLSAINVIETWTAAQSFTDGTLILLGSGSGSSTLKAPATGGGTATLFTGTDTIAGIASSQVLSNKTIDTAAPNTIKINGNTLSATAGAFTVQVPNANTVLMGRDTPDTMTNKTFDTAGASNSFLINGVGVTANTGTGAVVRATSPTLVTPALGTPASGNIANSILATMGAYSFKCNNTSGAATPTDCDLTAFTSKASPVAADIVLIQDSAASFAYKKTTVSALAAAGSVSTLNGQTGAVTLLTPPGGRLTAQQHVTVPTSTQGAVTTIYYDCYNSNQVPYYTGSILAIDTITGCDVSDAMVSAASAGQIVSGNVYDVVWAGHTICVPMSASAGGGGGWSSDTGGSNTARGTGYSQLDFTGAVTPFPSNKNSITNCFNGSTNKGPISANQATYLGTFYATANGTTNLTFAAAASGGTAGIAACCWNYHNRVSLVMNATDSGAGYSYNSATIRQAKGGTGMQVQIVTGAAEDAVDARDNSRVLTAAVSLATTFTGIGLDATNAFNCQPAVTAQTSTTQFAVASPSFCSFNPGVGLHTISSNEAADANNSSFNQSSAHVLSVTGKW